MNDEDEVQECFRTIQSEVLASTIKNLSYNENARIVTDKHTVKLPLRVNWGGGWSDTPPYCNENGGTGEPLGVRYSKEDIKRRKVERKFDKRSIKKKGV